MIQINQMDYSDRTFSILFYQMSHNEMVIRSYRYDNIRDIKYQNNIDIYIAGIKYVEIPSRFQGIILEKCNDEDIGYLCNKLDKNISKDEVIVLLSENKKYYIIASVIRIIENQLEHVELPIHSFLINSPDEYEQFRRAKLEE